MSPSTTISAVAGSGRPVSGLSTGVVLLHVVAAVLAGRDVQAEYVGLVDHHAVGRRVDPADLGIARDYHVARPDVAAAVHLVPLRHGEAEQVDLLALPAVL